MVSESSLDDGARTPGAIPLTQRFFLWAAANWAAWKTKPA
jgi:hypothetical protein